MRRPDADDGAIGRVLYGVLGSGTPLSWERTADGTSTQVYRVRRDGEVFYLRLAETAEASLAPEVEVHERLRAAGVRVPEVVDYLSFVEELERSVMVTGEIPGVPVEPADAAGLVAAVYRAAGRDLAAINSLRVTGFGWIRRDVGRRLWAEDGTYGDFVRAAGAVDDLATLGFDPTDRARIGHVLEREVRSGPDGIGFLAHGDLDTTHVFHRGGQYTGFIDFGEIRGTARWYDVGEFALHRDRPEVVVAVDALLQGYAQVQALPDDLPQRISDTGVLVTVHRLSRWLRRDGPAAASQPFFRWNRDRLVELIRK